MQRSYMRIYFFARVAINAILDRRSRLKSHFTPEESLRIRTLAVCVSMLLGSALQAREADRLHVTQNVADGAVQQLAGRGITLAGGRVSQPAYDVHGRELVWREDHRVRDERGGEHVFYKQYLVGNGLEAQIEGSDVGVHYEPDGRLDFVNGTQFDDVIVTNGVEVDAIGATLRARQSMQTFARMRIGTEETLETARREAGRAKLQVRDVDGELRYVWRVSVSHEGHGKHDVIIDAQTQRIIRTDDTMRANNCFPDSMTIVTAVGKPVRPEITTNRSLGATLANPARTPRPGYTGGTYTHEGFWAAGPLLAVHQQLTSTNQNDLLGWQCIDPYTSTQMGYTLMALNKNASNVPQYDDSGPFKGRAGGDALHHTRQTMLAFSTMGRNSWDGAGANATVVIEAQSAGSNQAFFDPSGTAPWDPPGAFVGIGKGVNYYSPAASLDVVAHEWGHGVTYTHPGFVRSGNTVADQLDEGFADVIGNIVEKLRQPSGNGLEQSSDWTMHEDVSGADPDRAGYLAYARGARDDGTLGHVWAVVSGTNPARTKDKIHVSDPDVTNTTFPHTTGNLLVMAMRLIAEGGSNPLCARVPSPITTCTSVTPLGFTNARKVMWNTLPNITSTASWVDVANGAMRAAYSQFKACGASPTYVPVTEQTAVRDAFIGVGITPTEAIKYTCN